MRVVCLLIGVLVVSSSSLAETYIVHLDGSGDFPTFQAAFDSAQSGDELLLGPGTHDIVHVVNYWDERAFTVRSLDGNRETCIVSGEMWFELNPVGETAEVRDLTYTSIVSHGGGGVYVENAIFGYTIVNGPLEVVGSKSSPDHKWHEILDGGGDPWTVTNCQFVGMELFAISIQENTTFNNCLIAENQLSFFNGTYNNCTISNNVIDYVGCCGVVEISDSIFSNNVDAVDNPHSADICSDWMVENSIIFNNRFLPGPAQCFPGPGVFFFDPLFCYPGGGEYFLCNDSNALFENNGVGLIGALGAGCGSCNPVVVERQTFGSVKAQYR